MGTGYGQDQQRRNNGDAHCNDRQIAVHGKIQTGGLTWVLHVTPILQSKSLRQVVVQA